MSIIGTIHEDVTTDVLGHIGTWQWMVVFLSATFMATATFNQYEDVIILAPPSNVQCELTDKSGVSNSSLCTYTIVNSTKEYACEKWQVKILWIASINKTWLVFCEEKTKLLAASIISRLGLAFGFVIFGLLCDSFGRKKTIVINIISELWLRLMLSLCDSESWFNLLIFLRSFFASANFYVALILVCEIASCAWRTTLMTIVSTPRLIATTYLVPIVNSAPNHETFNIFASMFDVLLIIILWWTPESPQWLLCNKKIPQAEKILMNAVKINNIDICSDFKIRPLNHRAYDCLDESWTCIRILNICNIRILTAAIVILWFIYYFLWSSLYLRIYIKQEQHSVLRLLISISVLALLNWCLLKKIKLRTLLAFNIMCIGACSITLIFIELYTVNLTFTNIITSLALGSGVIGHGLLLSITPRLFAINIRATLFGCCHFTGQLGSISCYLVIMINEMDDINRKILEATLAMVLTILCYVIPNVDGRELPDAIEDMNFFTELPKPLRWVTQKTNSPSQEELEIRVYSFSSAIQNSITQSDQHLPTKRLRPMPLWPLFRRTI